MTDLLQEAISRFGAEASKKLSNPAASGEPEDQLRAPLEGLIADIAAICGFASAALVAVGESSLSDLKTRPDYALTVSGALTGFIELKAPGKGADPRRFSDRHDREQWQKLQSLPNLLYTDGNSFSLWRLGEPVGAMVKLDGDVASAGSALTGSSALQGIFEDNGEIVAQSEGYTTKQACMGGIGSIRSGAPGATTRDLTLNNPPPPPPPVQPRRR